jgi:hypothetical protein
LGVVGEDEAGSLSLALTYKPFMDLQADSSAPINCRGALFVTLRQCQELPKGDWDSGDSDPYVLLKVGAAQCHLIVPILWPKTRLFARAGIPKPKVRGYASWRPGAEHGVCCLLLPHTSL